MTRLRFHSDAALREPYTLADASQAESMAVVMLGIESHAIVHDIELHSLGSPGQSDLRDTRSRMIRRVRERLLSDPVQTQRDVGIQRANAVGGVDLMSR
jgi:hypothetical protein